MADEPRGLTPNYTVAFDPMPLCIPDKRAEGSEGVADGEVEGEGVFE